ncbi:HWE histidine kinase domain-containing protein [Aurantimonas sp. HBX-1]|uniref:HWE histidine kinase domain-containing protein n=1 Tax=Aurantimonas sp. HBX-1 TaxID=2906072 RepID=UPI001F3F0778|nr:HWE histidine kinase domain-containing protein [Aurantimonas sp. HBX-1]UIJ70436.1 PAS domain-containing protein [Aurantimonas sp. HBX-1]
MPVESGKAQHQRLAEAEVDQFRQELGPFVVATERTRMPMVFTDAREPNRLISFANDAFLALTGYSRDEVLGKSINFLMAQGAEPACVAEIEAAFDGTSDTDPDVRFQRRDGSISWASVFVSPVTDDDGRVVQHFASFVDLTRHHLEQDRLRLLLSELNHRTQNTLATVMAIIGQTLKGMAEPEAIDKLEGRILALSKTQSLLGAENWDRIGIREILEQVLAPFEKNGASAQRFSIAGENVGLEPKTALSLAIAFHELATNALLHGAFADGASGEVAIVWSIVSEAGDDRLELQWQESGGRPVKPPSHKGFGFRLMQGLSQELGGEVTLSIEPSGVACRIVMPLSREAN